MDKALAEAIEKALQDTYKMDIIRNAFEKSGLYPFNPAIVLEGLPCVWPPPEQDPQRQTTVDRVAGFSKQLLLPSQKELVREAKEDAKLAAARVVREVLLKRADSLLESGGDSPDESILQAAEELRKAAEETVRLLSPPPSVCSNCGSCLLFVL